MNKKEVLFLIIVIISMLIWGGSWTSAKLISHDAPKQVLIFWRFLISFISFIPFIIFIKPKLRINFLGFIQVTLGAICLISYNLMFFQGLREGLAGEGGVIVTTMNPIFTFIITIIVFKQRLDTKSIIGLCIGLIGGILLIELWQIGRKNIFSQGNIYFIVASLSWAFLSVITQKSKTNIDTITFSFYTYLMTTLIIIIPASYNGAFNISNLNSMFWINIIYISIGATTIATTAYFIAASKLGASKASSFVFIVPTSAIFFSWLLLKEVPNLYTILGGVIALIAVYIINIKHRDKIKPNQVEII